MQIHLACQAQSLTWDYTRARRGAMKARIQAGAQIDALILTAPEPVRAPLRKLASKQRIRACAALRPAR